MNILKITKTYGVDAALIILICRVFLKTATLNDLENFILNNSVDWEKVYDLSSIQRIRPVVFRILQPLKKNVETEVFAKLRSFCILSSMRTLLREQEASRIIALINAKGVATKLYKGIDFAKFAYSDVSMREFSDIDIIISLDDIQVLIEVMKTEGYKMTSEEFYEKFPIQYCKMHKDFSFTKQDNYGRIISFEFHYKPTKKYVDLALSFSDLLGADYLDANNRLDATNYFKLMLISNGVTDYFPNLRSLIDLALISPDKKIEPEFKVYEQLWSELSSELFSFPIDYIQHKKSRPYHIILKKILNKKKARLSFATIIHLNILTSSGLKKKCTSLSKGLSIIFVPTSETIRGANFQLFFFYQVSRILGLITKYTLGLGKYKKTKADPGETV